MTTIQAPIQAAPKAQLNVPAHLPAYARTSANHSDIQPFEAQQRLVSFHTLLKDRDPHQANTLQDLLFDQGDCQVNGTLTPEQAKLIAKMARRFDREGDTFARNSAELALNASGLLLNEVLPHTVAQSIQADRESRRMRELRNMFLLEKELPF